MQNTIVEFVAKKSDPDVPVVPGGDSQNVIDQVFNSSNASAQTGDTIMLIVGIAMLLCAAIFLFFTWKKYFHRNNGQHQGSTSAKVNVGKSYVLLAVSILMTVTSVFVIGIGVTQKAMADSPKLGVSSNKIYAYVDMETGQVEFDKDTVINNTGEITKLESIRVADLEDIDDGDCNWTLNHNSNVLYNDTATDTETPLDTPVEMQIDESINVVVSSDISPEAAKSLVGKEVLSIDYFINIVPVEDNLLSWDEGSCILSVSDIDGNVIENDSHVDSGTQLSATVDRNKIDTPYYNFIIETDEGTTTLSFAKGDDEHPYTADFDMPDSPAKIHIENCNRKFYAVIDNDWNMTFFYDENYNDWIAKLDAGEIKKFYDNFEPYFNQILEEDQGVDYTEWPYRNDTEDSCEFVETITIDSSVADFEGIKSTAGMFYEFYSCRLLSGFEYFRTDSVTYMFGMFCDCASDVEDFNQVPDMSTWNTSRVDNMYMMFSYYGYSSSNLDKIPDLSNFDFSNVKYLIYMFAGYGYCSEILNDVPNFKNCDLSNVVASDGMFREYAALSPVLNVAPDFTGCDFSKNIKISDMFYEYGYSSQELDVVPKLNVTSVVYADNCFAEYGFSSPVLDVVPDVSDWDVSKCESMNGMFSGYAYSSESLNNVPDVSSWDTSSLTECYNLFSNYGYKSKKLSDVPNVSNWDVTKVVGVSSYLGTHGMDGMFKKYAYESPVIDKLPDISNWDISKSHNFKELFLDCCYNGNSTNMTLDFTNWDNNKDVPGFTIANNNFLKGCPATTIIVGAKFKYNFKTNEGTGFGSRFPDWTINDGTEVYDANGVYDYLNSHPEAFPATLHAYFDTDFMATSGDLFSSSDVDNEKNDNESLEVDSGDSSKDILDADMDKTSEEESVSDDGVSDEDLSSGVESTEDVSEPVVKEFLPESEFNANISSLLCTMFSRVCFWD